MNEQYRHLTVNVVDKMCRVTLNRPDVHNAFNRELIQDLRAAFLALSRLPVGQVRAVVLAGVGKSFCAGADVNWMRESLGYSEEENVADALDMAAMFEAIDRCPMPVVGRIHGAALGGGVGLAAVCDIVVAADDAVFAFSEARLGIAPAVISPYVLRKIGATHARALFFTAERFDAQRALQIGLIHIIKRAPELDAEIDRLQNAILASAPGAIARAKSLIAAVPHLDRETATRETAETIAALRVAAEGQEGLLAFLEKRKAEWVH
jgi:methylglutaconyl-CoA hydratase